MTTQTAIRHAEVVQGCRDYYSYAVRRTAIAVSQLATATQDCMDAMSQALSVHDAAMESTGAARAAMFAIARDAAEMFASAQGRAYAARARVDVRRGEEDRAMTALRNALIDRAIAEMSTTG